MHAFVHFPLLKLIMRCCSCLFLFSSVFINVCVCVCAEKTRGHRPPRLENRVPWMVRVWPNTPIPITFVERDPGISFFLTHYSVLVVT